jgi:AcrR family transcriptional regulator
MSEAANVLPKTRVTGSATPRKAAADEACGRPYHHGDLSRALVSAGRRILESEGPAALSLRAVAREAGVSPAAPYHHFKDKGELLDAVAKEGWRELGEAIGARRAAATDPRAALTEIGVAYVTFARQNPALYRLMYHAACDREMMPDHAKDEDSGWNQVEKALIDAGADPANELDMKLAQIAAWCNAHGVAEMAGFKEFAPLREALGGEEAFVRALLGHVGIFARRPRPSHD